jgi:hypothetical protein
MSTIGTNRGSGTIGPVKMFDATTSTDDAPSFELDWPVRFFSLQVEGGTDVQVTLRGHLALSTDSTGGITLIAWSSDTVGTVLSTESTGPISRVSATFDGGASSASPMSAWFSAAP